MNRIKNDHGPDSLFSFYREELLTILLHLTSLLLNPMPPKRKEETLGGRLAPAVFQVMVII